MGSLGNQRTPLWKPNPKILSELHLEIFRKNICNKYSVDLENYHDLHKWSVQNRSDFWAEVWDFCGVIHSEKYKAVVDDKISIDRIPKWFTGARLNYAENLLERGENDKVAVYYKGEGHPILEKLTFGQLKAEVAAWAFALQEAGVGKGDVVAGILPNCPQTLAAVLGTASLGAVWTCTSPDYGITGVVERFKQTEPKVVVAVNAVYYNGKVHNLMSKLEEILKELTTVKKVVVIPFITTSAQEENGAKADHHNFEWVSSTEFLTKFRSSKLINHYEQVPFDHPLFIMYSSGTTGRPKCMVHSVGGTLIKHLEEHILQSNLRANDVMFYYTTVGWMMYNWLISGLATGCSIVLYDGSPSPDLWSMIDDIGITIFGTSAKWLAVQEDIFLKNVPASSDSKLKLLDKNQTQLRMILSTGSPLMPQSFDFVYNYIKKDVVLGSISGGTDIIGCFMGQNPSLPVYKGEIQSYHLGCDMDCFDEDGHSVHNERGELVVKSAFPSMPIHFHNDTDGVLYHKAYFAKFNHIWAHGDFIANDSNTKGIVMLGRSDAVLNPSGVRFGSSEIYQIVARFPEISDSVCVGQRNKSGSDERVLLFVKLAPHQEFSTNLVNNLKKSIREHLSPRHVPAIIMQISDIPYTISGKKVEIAVRNVIEGLEVKNIGALANPDSLNFYRIPELSVWS